ncbi:MAG: hypothetical protein EBS53_18160, partial [Bacteroidetes bacterium]|nr:hypothetical protein [Bacteroidota bacterium]
MKIPWRAFFGVLCLLLLGFLFLSRNGKTGSPAAKGLNSTESSALAHADETSPGSTTGRAGAGQYGSPVANPSQLSTNSVTSAEPSLPNVIYLNAGAINTDLPATKARRQPLAYFSGKRMQLIQWSGPVQAGWVDELKKLGVEIIDYIPENAYLVYGDWNVLSAMQKKMADKNYVRWEGTYRPQDKIQPNALAAGNNGPASRPEPELFSIQMVLNPKANTETLKKIEQLQLASPIKQGPSGNYYNIVAKLPPAQIASLAEQPDIISIGPYQTPGKRDEKQC